MIGTGHARAGGCVRQMVRWLPHGWNGCKKHAPQKTTHQLLLVILDSGSRRSMSAFNLAHHHPNRNTPVRRLRHQPQGDADLPLQGGVRGEQRHPPADGSLPQHLAEPRPQVPDAERGWVVCNPPYGVRVGEMDRVRNLWARLGQLLRERAPGWRVTLLSPEPSLERQLGIPVRVVAQTTNGGIPVRLVAGDVAADNTGVAR